MTGWEPVRLSAEETRLSAEVVDFLERELPRGTFDPGVGFDAPSDRTFSAKLAERGWVGMTLPPEFGGGGRTAVERFLVVEQLLRWGAPVGYHWFADRQSGPMITRYGTQAQKEFFLPQICRGGLGFCIGMSEPGSGSDLASVRTTAIRVRGGWRINGTKVWTTRAHESEWMIALCRTSESSDPHDGLTQFLIDMSSAGVTVTGIEILDGTRAFNEVTLVDVFVPDDMTLGAVGDGWRQTLSELAFERSGPERWLSTYLVAEEWLRERYTGRADDIELLGSAVARWWGLRQLSLSVARTIDRGGVPAVQAALVKDLGTRFEQEILDAILASAASDVDPRSDSAFERVLARATVRSPMFTIRGGTNEILRSVTSRALTRRS